MIQQVDRAAKLITHLRAFGRVPDQAMSDFHVADAVEGTHSLVAAALATDWIELQIEILAEDVIVRGQSTLLEQVLVNLVLNARDSIKQRRTREPAIKGLIVLTLQKTLDGRISIVVDDNGTGIPVAAIEHLFEPFFTTKPVGKGTGLGLSVSYGIVTAMNGTIVASSIGMGARFEIVLPQSTPAADAVVRRASRLPK
jgi:C4-dicarboxylate-specific signal transduction histidine kinase